MTDETQTSETGATVTLTPTPAEKTIGQVVHEATVSTGEAEGEFHELADEIKISLEKFGRVIEAVVAHVLHRQPPQAPEAGNETTAG